MTGMIRSLIFIAFGLVLAGCGTNGTVTERDEFADAVEVLAAEDRVVPDPEFASQLISLPPPLENPAWPQTGGDADHTLVHLAVGEDLERIWRKRVISKKAKGAPITAPPIVGPDRLYMIDAVAAVHAVDAETGEELWETVLTPDVSDPKVRFYNVFARIDPKDIGFGGGAALDGGRLFVTSGFGFMAALDAASGELLWQVETPGPMRNPPTTAEGLVIAVSFSNQVLALDQETGEERWTFESFEESARFLASAAPAVLDESVIVPFSSGEVTSLNVLTGRVQWQAVIARTSRLNALSTLGDIAGSPVADRGAVFTASQSGQMAGIDLRTGAVAWEQPVGGNHTPWVSGETIFVLSNRGSLTALNRVDGRVRWTTALPSWKNPKKRKDRINWAGPVLAGGYLYLTGTNKEMIAVSPQDGDVVKRYKLKAPATQPPVVSEQTLYVMTEDGFVEAFRGTPIN